ncbi:MFS transporter [Halolamina litorea]|uniref:MFS transporter n=1 Tax=Halolamina litorea TaxID=1515593 RepID=A0ABD6BUM2_9EURY|nr:MFS transporter [Halolamina litorea]
MSDATDDQHEERLFRGYSGRLLLAVSLGWALLQAGRLTISPLLPAIGDDLGISSGAAGFAITVVWGTYAVLQYPSGRLSDRLSRTTLLVGGLALAAVGFLTLSAAPTYSAFLFGAVVIGVGVGLYPTPARGLVSDLFVAKRGRAFGLHTASGDVGGILAAGLGTAVLAVATWRAAFAPVAAALLLIALLLHLWSQEGYELATVDLAIGDTFRRILGVPRLRWLLVAYALYAFTWQAATGFLPTYLRTKELSPTVANAGLAVLFVVGAVVKPLAGTLGDRVPRGLLAPGVLLVAATALVAVVLSSTPVIALGGVAVFAAGLMAYPPVMQAYLMDSFPGDSMGGDLGAMRSVYIGIGSLGATYVGVVGQFLDYDIAFAGLVGCLLISSTVIVLRGRE